MSFDFQAGLQTAIDHGPQALGPVIDEMVVEADYESSALARRQMRRVIYLLRWMMENLHTIDNKEVVRFCCEFPRDLMAHWLIEQFDSLGGLKRFRKSIEMRAEKATARFSTSTQTISSCHQDGVFYPAFFVRWANLDLWIEHLDNTTDCRCHHCETFYGFFRTASSTGAGLVRMLPVTELLFSTLDILASSGNETFYLGGVDRLPSRYWSALSNCRDVAVLRSNVGDAALDWARREAGMQHDVNGNRYEPEGKKQAFIKHLEEASAEVATWPKWKQNCLGIININVAQDESWSTPDDAHE